MEDVSPNKVMKGNVGPQMKDRGKNRRLTNAGIAKEKVLKTAEKVKGSRSKFWQHFCSLKAEGQ